MSDDKQKAANFGLIKYVHLTYIVGAVIAGWLLSNVVISAWTGLNLQFVEVPSPNSAISILVGAGVALALTVYLWQRQDVQKLVVEIVTELSKVTWPTRKELYASTIVVVVFSVIASLILGMFDAFWSWVTGFIY